MQIYTRKSEIIYFETLHPGCHSIRGHKSGSVGAALECPLSNELGLARDARRRAPTVITAAEKDAQKVHREKSSKQKENERTSITWLPPSITRGGGRISSFRNSLG